MRILGLIISALKKYLDQKELPEEEKELVHAPFTFSTIIQSRPPCNIPVRKCIGSDFNWAVFPATKPVTAEVRISRVTTMKASPNRITLSQPCFILGFFVVGSVIVITFVCNLQTCLKTTYSL